MGLRRHACQPARMLWYWDLGTNLDEAFLIWNHDWYASRLSPVMRRATCAADSPRRIGWQSSDSENAADGAPASYTIIGSAHRAMRVFCRSTHLICSGAISEVVGADSSYVPEKVT
jgi:hypothetical protein